MTTDELSPLCQHEGCRLLSGHKGGHDKLPTMAWEFMEERDQNKLTKAGFATPRGGRKGAYQNHVVRSNRVIIPFERLSSVNTAKYEDDFVVRLFPEQYFQAPRIPRKEFKRAGASVIVGQNAFILYRTHESFTRFPPLSGWEIRGLVKDGKLVDKRGRGTVDTGHYVLRLPTLGELKARDEGLPQGLFAPEYANAETNYFCQCVLAWLIIHTVKSPYTTSQSDLLKSILHHTRLLDESQWEYNGVLRHGLTTCPLCSKFIQYSELHEMLKLQEERSLENAAEQVEGATRSTIVSLFHMDPLRYSSVEHVPTKVAWGHAICNTKLGQRRCQPLRELVDKGWKVGLVKEERIETFGWMSPDWEMIRSPGGAVWIRLCDNGAEEKPPESSRANFTSTPAPDAVAAAPARPHGARTRRPGAPAPAPRPAAPGRRGRA